MSEQRGMYKVALVAVADNTPGGALSLANPLGVDAIVKRIMLDVTTPATGAATIDAGIAANGTTASDNLLDGADVGTAAGVFDNLEDGGTNGKMKARWAAGEFLTITASATLAGLVGNVYLDLVRA